MARAFGEWPVAFADRPASGEAGPDVSFVIGHRGLDRLPHLSRVLASIAAQEGAAVECIVVEQSAEPEIAEQVEEVVAAIRTAKTRILVQAYNFTSSPIAKALLDAHTRGVRVEVILDQSNRTAKYSAADFLANQGVPTKIDATHAIAHNKIMIIDGELVITGSLNFSQAAQHSQPYVGRGVRQ